MSEASGRQASPENGSPALPSTGSGEATASGYPGSGPTEFDLRLAYLGRLSGRLEAIENAWSRFARDRDPADFEPLKTLVHRLVESAATYGLDEVSAMARDLDRQTHAVVAIGPFTERLAALRDAIGRATGGESR